LSYVTARNGKLESHLRRLSTVMYKLHMLDSALISVRKKLQRAE